MLIVLTCILLYFAIGYIIADGLRVLMTSKGHPPPKAYLVWYAIAWPVTILVSIYAFVRGAWIASRRK